MSEWAITGGQRGRGLHIEYSGPFFTGDPGKTMRGNLADVVAKLAHEGEKLEKALTPSLPTGETQASIHAVTQRASLYSSVEIAGSGDAPFARYWWLAHGYRSRVRSAGHKRQRVKDLRATGNLVRLRHAAYRMPMRAASALRKLVPTIVADLTKGLE
jgi:hypothetical protein